MDRNNEIPSIEYNFVKIEDIANVPDKEKIDVLVVCNHVEQCVDQSLRSGRTTKKREIRVSDDSKTEIMLTLWGEKAEKYGESIIGKCHTQCGYCGILLSHFFAQKLREIDVPCKPFS